MSDNGKSHSEDFFGSYRDFWWNRDFLRLMAGRWDLPNIKSVLDVGCGMGHWSEQLLGILPSSATVTGVDPIEKWVRESRERLASLGFSERFTSQQGSAEALPFPDSCFDMVTCQTVLIHVPDIPRAITEMRRVLKPGGLMVAVEPNNLASSLVLDSFSFQQSVDEIIESVRFHLMCERGKTTLGLGNISAGDLIPGLMQKTGLKDIRVYLSDKTLPLIPPYETNEQKALVHQLRDWEENEIVVEDRETTLRYFLTAGGTADEFEQHWQRDLKARREMKNRINNGLHHSAGGALMYLVSGRR